MFRVVAIVLLLLLREASCASAKGTSSTERGDVPEKDGTHRETIASEFQLDYDYYGCGDDDAESSKKRLENIFGQKNAASDEKMVSCFCGLLRDVAVDKDMTSRTSRSIATATSCTDGIAESSGGNFPCLDVDLEYHMPVSTFSSVEANDVWGWTYYGTNGTDQPREFALIGLMDGTGFVEITEPSDPIYIGKLPANGSNSPWRDLKTNGNYLFTVSEAGDHGMQIMDLTLLLNATPGTIFEASALYNKVGNIHNIAINEDTSFAYLVGGSNGCNGGLHIVDISDALNPTQVGCFGDDGYTHDAHCVLYHGPDTAYVGREICFCSNEDTVTIVDVTDKTNPALVSRTSYEEKGYTHQGWLSTDHGYFVFGDETDELGRGHNTRTLLFDVSDLQNPTNFQEYFASTLAIDHNLYITEHNGVDYVYQANYRAGLRVLKVLDYNTANFSEVGFFDIYPFDDMAHFNGAWSVYPFFPSGTVVVSGIEEGLFVLRPNQNIVEASPPVSASPTTTTRNSDPTTPEPSRTPSHNPTGPLPTSPGPTGSPSLHPSGSPTSSPSFLPSRSPTSRPSFYPSGSPMSSPTESPSFSPSRSPSSRPTSSPSLHPSESPTSNPSLNPSVSPTLVPTESLSSFPSESPSSKPTTSSPSLRPSGSPTSNPSLHPSVSPTLVPTDSLSSYPSESPSSRPTTSAPTEHISSRSSPMPQTGSSPPVAGPGGGGGTGNADMTASPSTHSPTNLSRIPVDGSQTETVDTLPNGFSSGTTPTEGSTPSPPASGAQKVMIPILAVCIASTLQVYLFIGIV